MRFFGIVYHNQNPLAMVRGYQKGDEMKLVQTFVLSGEWEEVAEKAFRISNQFGGAERSLSVGDGITLTDPQTNREIMRLVVVPFGWEVIS